MTVTKGYMALDSMTIQTREEFEKYAKDGAYHWVGSSAASLDCYDPELEARYLVALKGARRVQGDLRGRKMLDAGCGDGVFVNLLRYHGAKPLGMDAERLALDLAKGQLRKNGFVETLIVGSCEAIPFRPASFDAVFAVEVLEHLRNPLQFVDQACRLLKEDGTLVLTTPNRRADGQLRSRFHHREFTGQELQDLLKGYFHICDVLGFCHPWIVKAAYGIPGMRQPTRQVFKRFARTFSNPCAWLFAGRAATRCESLIAVAHRVKRSR